MHLLAIRLYGDSNLRKKAQEVKEFDQDLARLVEDMLYTMKNAEGIGLAANQVGILKRVFVVDISPLQENFKPLVVVNPQILQTSGSQIAEEGCLSIPGIYEEVERPEKVWLEAFDIFGKKFRLEAGGLLARVILHENDHLDGILFTDRISSIRRQLLSKKLKKISQQSKVLQASL